MTATSRSDVWAVGESRRGYPRALHYDGSSWSVVTVSHPVGGRLSGLQAIDATSPSDAWAVGFRPHGNTLTEHWNGKAWRRVRTPGNLGDFYAPASVAATSRSDVWAVVGDHGGTSMIIHWDGTTWQTVRAAREFILSIAASNPNDAWAVGLQGSFPSLRPATWHWDGATWSRTVLPPHGALFDGITHVPASTTYWAVGSVRRGGQGHPIYFTPLLESYC